MLSVMADVYIWYKHKFIVTSVAYESLFSYATFHLHFSLTDPHCHANEIWDKIGYNSVTVVIGLDTVRQNLKRSIFVTDHQ